MASYKIIIELEWPDTKSDSGDAAFMKERITESIRTMWASPYFMLMTSKLYEVIDDN